MHLSLSRNRRRQGGFSLVEVMIALLVLALGLLGFALLQTMNLRYTQSADYRTRATDLAAELLDQMRVNKMSANEYPAASFVAGSVSGANCPRTTSPAMPVTGTNSAISRWQCRVVAALGADASAVVNYNATSGLASVVINWGERESTSPNTSFAVETYL